MIVTTSYFVVTIKIILFAEWLFSYLKVQEMWEHNGRRFKDLVLMFKLYSSLVKFIRAFLLSRRVFFILLNAETKFSAIKHRGSGRQRNA